MEFNTFKISDIADVQTGPFGSQLHKEDYVAVGTPIITVEHLGENKIIHSNLPKVKREDWQRLSKYVLKENDIVFSRVGSVDRCALVSEKENNWLFSGRCLRVRVKDTTKVDPKYLSYYFSSKKFKSYIRSIAVGATMPSINTKILSEIKIKLPDIFSQRKISKLLYQLDSKIWCNEQLIKKLEQISQILFKNWFIDFEFPNEEGKPYKSSGGEMVESELGEIPKGWISSTISEVVFLNKGSYSKKDEWSFINYLDTSSITNNSIDNIHLIDVEKEKVPSRAKRKLLQNDIVYSTVRPNQYHYGLIKEPLPNMLASTGFTVIRSKGEYPNDLIYMRLTQKDVTKYLQSVAEQSTSAYPSIKADDIGKLEILIPQKKLIEKLNDVICKNHNQIWNHQQENKNLTQLRDTLLPKLLSGEIEIPDDLEV